MSNPDESKPRSSLPYSWGRVIMINLMVPGFVILVIVLVAALLWLFKPFGPFEEAVAFMLIFLFSAAALTPIPLLGMNLFCYLQNRGIPKRREAADKFRIMIYLSLVVVIISALIGLFYLILFLQY